MERRFVTQRVGMASLLAALGLLIAAEPRADAVVKYWDTSAATGIQVGNGTWNTGSTALWNTSAAGSNPLTTWADDDVAFWVAPTSAGPSVITLNGTVKLGIDVGSDGNHGAVQVNSSGQEVTFNGGTLQLDNPAGTLGFVGFNPSGPNTKLTVNSNVLLNAPTGAYTIFKSSTTGSGFFTINGNISETHAGNIVRLLESYKATTFTGSNTFTGGLQLDADLNPALVNSLTATKAASLGLGGVCIGASAGNTILNLNFASNDTAANAFKFNLRGTGVAGAATINSTGAGAANLSNTGQITFGALAGSTNSLGALTIKFGGASAAANTFAGVIKNSGTGLDITSVTKQDAGTWVLTGTNIYSGATTVNGGKLVVGNGASGSIANSAVTVNTGATLGGSGTTGALTIAGGGNVAPGNSIGTLNVSSLDISGVDGTGGLQFELGTTGVNDKINASGALTLGTLDFSDFTFTHPAYPIFFGGETYTLMLGTSLMGSIGTAAGSLGSNASGTLFLDGNDVKLTVSVPEPASAGLLLGMAAMGLMFNRRRRIAKR